MNTTTRTQHLDTSSTTSAVQCRSPEDQAIIARVVRRERRARDYGVGYGSSSGYASGRHYAENWGNVRFQCG